MSNRPLSLVVISVCLAVCLSSAPSLAQQLTSDTLSGLWARPIGPTVMGGRIADITAIAEGQRLTVYVGAAGGGLWRSVDGGTTFKPVFDKQPTQSIGSIAVDPSHPKTAEKPAEKPKN